MAAPPVLATSATAKKEARATGGIRQALTLGVAMMQTAAGVCRRLQQRPLLGAAAGAMRAASMEYVRNYPEGGSAA